MSNLDRFLAEGAYTCAGSVVHKGVEVGTVRDGDLALNDKGRDMLAKLDSATDVVVKAPKAKAKKAEAEVDMSAAEADAALDALLGE